MGQAADRTILLRATSQELGASREKVVDAVVQRLDLPRKPALDAYTLAEQHETNPRSVWGYVQGLTRLSQNTPWQDTRFTLDRAASRLLATVPDACPARDPCRARGCLRSQSPGAQRRCVRCAISSVFTHDSPSLTASRINPFTR